ncbi:MAG: homocysteine S-methyltransferase family protein [Anaerolineales bacterium]|jgi:5-methyltetrahydrofolate--homocysteine methyltransferase
MPDFRKKLNSNRILIADGATGTMLQKAGLPIGVAPERWNLENPDAVLNHYLAYIEAGSDIILTNTFGGSYIRLKRDNLQDDCQNINKRAADLARQAAGSSVIVFGDLGPTGELISPLGLLSENEVVESFAIQVNGLVQGGVDAILIETMSDLIEAKAALKAVKQVTDLPVIISFSFDTRGRTMMGIKPDQAAEEIWPLGVTAIGANCGRTLSETLKAIQEIRMAVPEADLFAKPNAGLPHTDGSELIYDVTPHIMAEFALKFIDAGVKIFGGCCGSTPEHIKAITSTIRSLY